MQEAFETSFLLNYYSNLHYDGHIRAGISLFSHPSKLQIRLGSDCPAQAAQADHQIADMTLALWAVLCYKDSISKGLFNASGFVSKLKNSNVLWIKLTYLLLWVSQFYSQNVYKSELCNVIPLIKQGSRSRVTFWLSDTELGPPVDCRIP